MRLSATRLAGGPLATEPSRRGSAPVYAGEHRVVCSAPHVGPAMRATLGQAVATPAAASWGSVVPGCGMQHHPEGAPLSLAGGGSRRQRAGDARATAPGHASGPARLPPAPQRRSGGPPGAHPGSAQARRGRQARAAAGGRAPPAAVPQQPCRALTPANAATGTTHAGVEVRRACATISRGIWAYRPIRSTAAPSVFRARLPSRNAHKMSRVGGDDRYRDGCLRVESVRDWAGFASFLPSDDISAK
jgi:hypothetical protein